ncbi:MAG: Gfo/Idh/MocA family oxidoreductase [Gemmataceae bacterium]
MPRRFTRRDALKASAAGTLGYFFTGPALSVASAAGANGKLYVAGVGIGGKGDSDIDQASKLMEVVALCDIDDHNLDRKKKKWEKAKGFNDYRKLFDDEVFKSVDAVTVSTPDHHHAPVAVTAMRAKKHVYVQKPLTHTVFEARLMRETARKYGVCTQMGNQGTAENGLRRAVEVVQSGVIGDVKEVHCWTNRPVWPQGPDVLPGKYMPKEAPVPSHVHWEEFIGPAAMRPYAVYEKNTPRAYGGRLGAYHDFHWRGWWAFGTGAIGDMACHTANMAFMALKLTTPTHVKARADDVNPETCSSNAHVTMEFAARGSMPACTLHWYEGKKDGKLVHPPEELVAKVLKIDPDTRRNKSLVNSGSIIVGSKGFIYSPNDYGAQFYLGGGDFSKVNTTKPESLAINNQGDQGQKNEWVKAIKANDHKLALSNFDYASYLTEAFLLGNVAIRSGKAFEYDGETGHVKNCPEAEAYITKAYRAGWDLLGKSA